MKYLILITLAAITAMCYDPINYEDWHLELDATLGTWFNQDTVVNFDRPSELRTTKILFSEHNKTKKIINGGNIEYRDSISVIEKSKKETDLEWVIKSGFLIEVEKELVDTLEINVSFPLYGLKHYTISKDGSARWINGKYYQPINKGNF